MRRACLEPAPNPIGKLANAALPTPCNVIEPGSKIRLFQALIFQIEQGAAGHQGGATS